MNHTEHMAKVPPTKQNPSEICWIQSSETLKFHLKTFFFWLYPQHMEVPGIGTESEPQL